MTTERKIEALNILMARGLKEDMFFMCLTLQALVGAKIIGKSERTILINELWVDRIFNSRTSDYLHPTSRAWYPTHDQDVRIRNIKYTIERLENTLK